MRVPRKILILTIFYIKIILILCVNLFAGFSTNEIEPEPGWGVRFSSITWGDYDNDGDLDLAVAGLDGNGTNRFRVYKNNGDGTFDGYIEPEPGWGVDSCSIAWGDYDNDGDLDLAVTGEVVFPSKRLRVYKNKGDGTFDGYVEPEPNWGVVGGSIAWGDYDNDGDMDLAVTGAAPTWILRIYKNKGNGTFDGYIEPKPGWTIAGRSLIWGDYDNDGDLDLAISGFDGNHRLVVIKNNGNGTFNTNEIEPEPSWGVSSGSIAWGDYDNDGDLDLAISGQDAGSIKRFRVYKNNGNGTFNTNEIEPEPGWGVTFSSIAWGDYDNDGDLDLAVAGQAEGTTRRFRVYKNNSVGTFNTNEIEPEPGWGADMGSIAWGDYDNDGDLDLAVTGLGTSGGRVLRIYENLESTINNVPSTPTGMQSVNVADFWRFQWNAATDDHTSKNVLRYKIAIGINQSGDYDYISDAIDYPRGQANIGNIPQGWISGTQCFYQSKISVTKKVYWKVGAIDSAFKFTWSGENIALLEEEPLEKSEYSINNVVLIPNPFNPYKSKKNYITFFNAPDDIEIKIYNILGDKLVELKDPNSEHQIIWYGTDSKGNALSRGVYLALLKDNQGNKRTIKFVIQR